MAGVSGRQAAFCSRWEFTSCGDRSRLLLNLLQDTCAHNRRKELSSPVNILGEKTKTLC
jgi:hypothetical protein